MPTHVADLLRYLRDILFGIAHGADEVYAELFRPDDFHDLFVRAPVLAPLVRAVNTAPARAIDYLRGHVVLRHSNNIRVQIAHPRRGQ